MKLVVGLGNPGREYTQTRHNVGFILIDKFLSELNLDIKVDNKLNAALVKTNISGEQVIFAKPLTYMNLSGQAVSKIANYYKIDLNDIIVVSDDTALALGKIRLRETGSHGGQNGLRNIIQELGTANFKRLRVGIGDNPIMNKADYVLGKFTPKELEQLIPAINLGYNAIFEWIKNEKFNNIMTRYNTPQAE
ncbi:aminoacyl-tRNA hydrolase [Acholeplasma hippikon]|uniref:Peptidyl-tRNA hydrolase n=1 Tax=Acholeplasma hippikon TaxID=264636 RepID=A0A449BKM7_9MOLU|nr:aminoacyl-tRNA hydrolase [Acholeplasma hippikon]VEU83018.1 peptidyl-tRNA hydrolase [Acholeplasma hippikon]